MQEKGAGELYERLKSSDPAYAASITVRDRHKIIRALEIMAITNQKVSQLPQPSTENVDLYDFRCWFVYMSREILYPRIEMRCDQMVASGFIDEVIRLEKEGISKNATACQAIGYRQALDYLSSPRSPEDWEHFMIEFKQASRRYAKRQFTWFRREPLFRWINIDKMDVENIAEMIIQDYELGF